VRKELGVRHSLATTLEILSVSAFEKVPLHQLLAQNDPANSDPVFSGRLEFNGF
jgi:hypothetical protein